MVSSGAVSQDIVSALYKNYYESSGDNQAFISSHWQYYLPQVQALAKEGRIVPLRGDSFGDFQNTSLSRRLFSMATIGSYLLTFKDRWTILKLIKVTGKVFKRLGFHLTYDGFRQICSLALIAKHIPNTKKKITVLCIGDGYGLLSDLIKEIYPHAKICLLDLGKILTFQAHFCQQAHPESKHVLKSRFAPLADERDADFTYCPAEDLSLLDTYSFDLVVNIASMQEMNEDTIRAYFSFLRGHMKKDNLFYCCNRIEKQMPGGEASRILSYPWDGRDVHIVDEICPWFRYFFSSWTLARGPKVMGWRIPFINYFDGDIHHRLTRMHISGKAC
ncbi:MAG TPA: putative sugar O-methyltransferase [Candidatus Omnitrophota bacterium]|nr:putative sugar O-methyltransferase [Candidatus Omnitrophota bacterium]HPD84089.1 putative sugar O-methyltransferase [Candidatus Omnitrophota bacterium]HRZ02946.1 putative sugar O-methyltransferase [Candidatus Omnitrophota bacterium]